MVHFDRGQIIEALINYSSAVMTSSNCIADARLGRKATQSEMAITNRRRLRNVELRPNLGSQ
jgi:hypothetical protein